MGKINIREHPKYKRVYVSGALDKPKLYTINFAPGRKVYGERLIEQDGIEYREWDPYRSKIAAILLNNPINDYFSSVKSCLYLGAASGTTISHLSDIMAEGYIYAVEFAERSIRQLVQNMVDRPNVIPILGDARHPDDYSKSIFSKVDLLYQDVAQPNQSGIAIANADYYLEEGGIIILAVKSQSIDSLDKPEKVFKKEEQGLINAGYDIIETLNIHRYAAEHAVLIAKK